MIHEFAHTVHLIALNSLDPGFEPRLKAAYKKARKEGKWDDPAYAGVNFSEYWAEGVQNWFNNNRENDNQHNEINTRAEMLEYDAGLSELVREVYGEREWTYTKPWDRPESERAHLRFLARKDLPAFRWKTAAP